MRRVQRDERRWAMLEAEAHRVRGLEEEQVVLEMYHRYAVGLVMHFVAKVNSGVKPILRSPDPLVATHLACDLASTCI